jgi:hypothetical protein
VESVRLRLCTLDHTTIFTNMVRSLLEISKPHRVPSVIFDNLCRCLWDGSQRGLVRYTEHITPVVFGQIPRPFLFSNTVGTVGGVPNRRIRMLCDCKGPKIF